MSSPQQGFPQLAQRFVDPQTGILQQPWYNFLLALWNRTGGGPGVSTSDLELLSATTLGLTENVSDPGLPLLLAQIASLTPGDPQQRVSIQFVSASTWSPSLADAYTYTVFTNASGCVVTVPAQSTEPWPSDPAPVFALQQGSAAGQVEVQGAGGVVINTLSIFNPKSFGPNAVMQLIRTDEDEFTLFGAQEFV